jgi:hypothetical protein
MFFPFDEFDRAMNDTLIDWDFMRSKPGNLFCHRVVIRLPLNKKLKRVFPFIRYKSQHTSETLANENFSWFFGGTWTKCGGLLPHNCNIKNLTEKDIIKLQTCFEKMQSHIYTEKNAKKIDCFYVRVWDNMQNKKKKPIIRKYWKEKNNKWRGKSIIKET